MTGVTGSQNLPTLNPIEAAPENFSDRAFVTKFDPAGTIADSTYLSGHASDVGLDIAVDTSARAHVVGMTSFSNFPTVNAREQGEGILDFSAWTSRCFKSEAAVVITAEVSQSHTTASCTSSERPAMSPAPTMTGSPAIERG